MNAAPGSNPSEPSAAEVGAASPAPSSRSELTAEEAAPTYPARKSLGSFFLRHQTLGMAFGHALIFGGIYFLAFGIRTDFSFSEDQWVLFWTTVPWVLAIKLVVFYYFGNFHWWHYITFADLIALIRTTFLAFAAIAFVDYFNYPNHILPRLVPIYDAIFTLVILGGIRASGRFMQEGFSNLFRTQKCRKALLVGADHSSAILAHQIQSHTNLDYRICGLIDAEGTKTGMRFGQLTVLGGADELCAIAAENEVTEILVISGVLSGPRMRQLMDDCKQSELTLKIIPPVEDLFDGDHYIPMRDIEINDLLRRDPVRLDSEAIGKLLQDRVVMVTGAGGSIGSEICRQVIKFNPRFLVLVGRGENRIFRIENELKALGAWSALGACIADVNNPERMRQIFEQYRPEVVFHAAAHKHVPLMEANIGEALRNNVMGTKTVADLSEEFGVLSFVLISTDKAVRPTSVMGVSKHLAERYVHALSQESATHFIAVRFGNVLGSDGSVVPLFQDQIRRGGPITVTDPRMTRFFMTIPEASQLVLQAAAMGSGGEIFVLEMGEPVRIVDLAQDLIRLSGLPENAIEITFTGIRPGEKLFEELYFEDEETLPTGHPKLRAAYHRLYTLAEVRQSLKALEDVWNQPPAVIRRKLQELVPDYHPSADRDSFPATSDPRPPATSPTPTPKIPIGKEGVPP
ncbi:MAG: polysaccharide biosynthesis protein [Pirellulales bacterium]|nr:polysaccharide biosynthesis protein [Pirellulales bacterium]